MPHIRLPTVVGNEGVKFREMDHDGTAFKAAFPLYRHAAGALIGQAQDALPQVGILFLNNIANARKWGELSDVVGLDCCIFARMLAKIAYCWGVAEAGLNKFEPIITDFILGKDQFWPYYVGRANDERSVQNEPYLHWLHLLVTEDNKAGRMLVGRVHLFAPYRVPAYDVAIGRLRDSP